VIEATSLLKGQELVWLAGSDRRVPRARQRSAFIELADGSLYRLGYPAKNGRTFTSLGKELEATASSRRVRASLRTNPRWAASASNEELGEYLQPHQRMSSSAHATAHPTAASTRVTANARSPPQALFRAARCIRGRQEGEPTGIASCSIQDTGGAIRPRGAPICTSHRAGGRGSAGRTRSSASSTTCSSRRVRSSAGGADGLVVELLAERRSN